jgi:hypothetical protein
MSLTLLSRQYSFPKPTRRFSQSLLLSNKFQPSTTPGVKTRVLVHMPGLDESWPLLDLQQKQLRGLKWNYHVEILSKKILKGLKGLFPADCITEFILPRKSSTAHAHFNVITPTELGFDVVHIDVETAIAKAYEDENLDAYRLVGRSRINLDTRESYNVVGGSLVTSATCGLISDLGSLPDDYKSKSIHGQGPQFVYYDLETREETGKRILFNPLEAGGLTTKELNKIRSITGKN